MSDVKQSPEEIQSLLDQHTGTEVYYKHPFNIRFTDGVKHMADLCGAWWLIDLVASHQTNKRLRTEPFQIWFLDCDGEGTTARCHSDYDDDHPDAHPALVTQHIPYTDFPLKSIKLYLIDRILLLPSEY